MVFLSAEFAGDRVESLEIDIEALPGIMIHRVGVTQYIT